FRAESDELRVKAIFHESKQSAVLGPAKVKDRPVHTGTAEILSGSFAMPSEDKVVRRGAVFAAANERHPLAVRRDADIAEGATRSERLSHRIGCFAVTDSIRETKKENALGILIRFRAIRGAEHQARSGGMPHGFTD